MTGAAAAVQLLGAADAEHVWRCEFALGGDTAAAARRWLRASLSEHIVRERLETAALLIEEIVASSMRRTLSDRQITVLLAVERELLRVDVIDAELDGERISAPETGGSTRGLSLVASKARSWGMTLGPPARVWFAI